MKFYKSKVLNDPALKLCRVLLHNPDSPSGGHFEYDHTFRSIRRTFSWQGMKKDVQKKMQECDVCQHNKAELVVPLGLLDPLI